MGSGRESFSQRFILALQSPDRLRSDVRRSVKAPLETSLTCKDLVSLQGIYTIPDLTMNG